MLRNIFLFISFLAIIPAIGQKPEGIDKDVLVAEKILSNLFSGTSGGSGSAPWASTAFSSGISGDYIEGIGVVFTLNRPFGQVWAGGLATTLSSDFPQVYFFDKSDGSYELNAGSVKIDPAGIAIAESPKNKGNEKEKGKGVMVARSVDNDSLQQVRRTQFEQAIYEFCSDYAYLLQRVPESEKLIFRYKNEPGWGLAGNLGNYHCNRLSAQVNMSDVRAARNGKIQPDELKKRIKFEYEAAENAAQYRDLEMFADVLSALYAPGQENQFMVMGQIPVEYLPGLGATISLNFHYGDMSPFKVNGRNAAKPFENPNPETWKDFIAGLKQELVQYGVIVKSVKQGEFLRLIVHTSIEPENNATISIPGQTLQQLAAGKISPEQALQQIKVQ